MGVVVACKSCGKRLSIPAKLYESKVKGRVVTVNCKVCGAAVRVDGTLPPPPPNGTERETGSEIPIGSEDTHAPAIPKAARVPSELAPAEAVTRPEAITRPF